MATPDRSPPMGQRHLDAYRTIPEPVIVGMLSLAGFAFEPDTAAAEAIIRQALDRWCGRGLGFVRGPEGLRLFDPVEVTAVLKLAARFGGDTFLARYFAPTGRRLVQRLATRPAGGFVLDFTRRFHLPSHAAGDRVRLRAPLPLRDYLGALASVAPRHSGVRGDMSVSDGRLELRGLADGLGVAELGFRAAFDPSAEPGGAGSAGDYLRPSEGLIQVSDRVRDLADRLAGPGATPRAALRAFWNFLLDDLMCGAIHYDQVTPTAPCDWVLDSGWYDCQLGSALLVALCRARRMPARLVGGHVLYRAAPTNHYWAEVWLEDEGWRPFDLLCWDLSGGGAEAEWRDHFFGRIDPRMVTQCFPRQFTGALGVPLPPAWHVLQLGTAHGVEIRLNDITGRPVFVDTVAMVDAPD
jgi:hypothetical protein